MATDAKNIPVKLGFDDFKNMAQNSQLSCFEKIGFPDSYRESTEAYIFEDIQTKLQNLKSQNRTILDIGPGCSNLPKLMIDHCKTNQHQLLLVDSAEMLDLLPNDAFIQKTEGPFPSTPELIEQYKGKVDCILAYSVLQHAFADGLIWQFIDTALSLLAPGGEFLIGDIPNISKRKRFFASENGIQYHQEFTKTSTIPEVIFNVMEPDYIDDGCLFGIMLRARMQGFDSYLMPQDQRLAMQNRREDLLIKRP